MTDWKPRFAVRPLDDLATLSAAYSEATPREIIDRFNLNSHDATRLVNRRLWKEQGGLKRKAYKQAIYNVTEQMLSDLCGAKPSGPCLHEWGPAYIPDGPEVCLKCDYLRYLRPAMPRGEAVLLNKDGTIAARIVGLKP